MGGLRNLVRWAATAIVVLLIAPVACRVYVGLAEDMGRYDQPWHKATSAVWSIAQTVDLWWFSPLLFFSAGVAATLWAVDRLPTSAGLAGRHPIEAPAADDLEARQRIIDTFAAFFGTKMRAACRAGAALLGELPARIEDGTAEKELTGYTGQVLPVLMELQNLTRLYHAGFRDVTEIVAATMAFNYFEVVSASRDLVGELKIAAGAADRDPARALDESNKYVAAFRSAVARLQEWTEQRVQLLADKRKQCAAAD